MSKTHEEHGDKGFLTDQRQFFDDLITIDWDTYNNVEWDQARQLEVREIMKRTGSIATVLDVGCGSGYHDCVFAEYPSVTQVIGIDYSPKSIEQANAHFPHEKVQRFVADISDPEAIVQKTGYSDLVTSFQVIEHLEDGRSFLENCRACCADGGYIAVVTPNRLKFMNRVKQLMKRPIQYIDPLHFHEFTITECQNLGTDMNLEYVGHFGHGFRVSLGKGRILIKNHSPISKFIASKMPHYTNVIGIVFRKR